MRVAARHVSASLAGRLRGELVVCSQLGRHAKAMPADDLSGFRGRDRRADGQATHTRAKTTFPCLSGSRPLNPPPSLSKKSAAASAPRSRARLRVFGLEMYRDRQVHRRGYELSGYPSQMPRQSSAIALASALRRGTSSANMFANAYFNVEIENLADMVVDALRDEHTKPSGYDCGSSLQRSSERRGGCLLRHSAAGPRPARSAWT